MLKNKFQKNVEKMLKKLHKNRQINLAKSFKKFQKMLQKKIPE